jgi:Cd2+/Zn2+-exporting ATPase
VEILNALHLGVSVQDVANHTGDEDIETVDQLHAIHVAVVSSLFLLGLGFYLSPSLRDVSAWIFVTCIGIGIVPIMRSAIISLIIRWTLDIHLLMMVAIAGAVASADYFDGALVVSLFLVADFLESVVVLRVRQAVSLTAGGVLPKEAYLASGKTVSVRDLNIGDVLAVRTGEMIVCDGAVVKGEGVVDESALTGEAAPVSKKVGSSAFSGTVVQNGYMEILAEKNPQESTLARLSRAVAEVQADRGQYAKSIDTFAMYWTPAVLLATIILVAVGGGTTGEWAVYVHRGLVLLVLACPCAIVISAPIPSLCAIATAAQSGVLIRGSTIIERMSTINTVAVDKTGTMTKALFKVCDKLLFNPVDYDVVMVAAAVEQKSLHPLANAIVSDFCGCIAEMADVALPAVRKLKVLDGVGLEAWVEVEGNWKYVVIGNERILKPHGGKVALTKQETEQLATFQAAASNKVVLLMAIEDDLVLAISLADEVRPEAAAFISTLQSGMNMPVTMLTGDHQQVAEDVCHELHIPLTQCFARLLPDQKLAWIDRSQNDLKKHVLMIGDGINDSIALAASTVGVAMGAEGTAMTVASADVILMNDNLMLLPPALKLCRLAKSIIIENFVFAIAVKIAATILAIMGMLEFWEAVLVDIGSLLIVVLNGVRTLHRHGEKVQVNK